MQTTRRSRPAAPPATPADMPADLATCQQQLLLARAQNGYLHRQLALALQQAQVVPAGLTPAETLPLEVQALREQVAMLTLHYADAQGKIAWLTHDLAMAHRILHWEPMGEEQTNFDETQRLMDGLFKRLLATCHPDKWSQGQCATELAHELTVVITAMRDA